MSSISLLNKTLNEEKMRFHDELNPAIWEGNKLKDKVAMKLMEIASNFVAYLDTEGFIVEDIIITGSMANYNYTEQSDIDLHIICDYAKLPTNCPILSQEYFQAKKKIYNDKHNIKIYGYDVELYVEDSTAPSLAGGKYSLLQGKWLRFPQKIDFEVEDVVGTEELQDLITQVENVCMTDGNIEEANELLNHIYEMRKTGLANNGEFAFENLLFKALRNRGYLDKLRSYIANAEDLSLSLNESIKKLTNNENNNYYEKYYFAGKCNDTNDGNVIQEITHWEEFDCNPKYYGLPKNDKDIELISNNQFLQMITNQIKPKYIEYCAINKKMDILWAYDTKGIHWFYTKNGSLFEQYIVNESIVYASKNDLSDIILKNPTRKELKDNNMDFSRVIIDEGNFYFGLANHYDHTAMADNLLTKGIYCSVEYNGSLFYSLSKNTWLCREDWETDEEYKEYKDNTYRWLSNIPYIKENFPNFNVDLIQEEDYDVYESQNLNKFDFNLDEVLNKYLNKDKPLTESIMFNDKVYDDFQEEYRQLTVWVNPSIDWIRSKLDEAGGFRFLHSLDKNKLYVFTVDSGFMHQQVFDMLDFDWSKDGRNVVGVFNPDNSISIWESLADDGEASSSLKLAEELDGDLFKQIYPNGYRLDICY